MYLLRKYIDFENLFMELKCLVHFFFSPHTNSKSGGLTRPLILLVLQYDLSPEL